MVSTIGVRFSPPFAGPLDAAKAALTALGEALRQELAPWGIRVVLVEPATTNSGAADKVTRDAARGYLTEPCQPRQFAVGHLMMHSCTTRSPRRRVRQRGAEPGHRVASPAMPRLVRTSSPSGLIDFLPPPLRAPRPAGAGCAGASNGRR